MSRTTSGRGLLRARVPALDADRVVVSIYLVRELELSPLELVLMGTAMQAALFVFEVPTGVVADT
jgi:hypothetical protein